MVSVIRGRCFIALAKMSRAVSRLLPAYRSAIFGPFLDLVEIAVVRIERVCGFLVGPIIHAQRTKKQLSTCRSSNGCYEIAGNSETFQKFSRNF
jgi:hypothetical protein